jgi:hypothetical protein
VSAVLAERVDFTEALLKKPVPRDVLRSCAHWAHHDGTNCTAGVRTIAKWAGHAVSTTSSALVELRRQGYLTWTDEHVGKAPRGQNWTVCRTLNLMLLGNKPKGKGKKNVPARAVHSAAENVPARAVHSAAENVPAERDLNVPAEDAECTGAGPGMYRSLRYREVALERSLEKTHTPRASARARARAKRVCDSEKEESKCNTATAQGNTEP